MVEQPQASQLAPSQEVLLRTRGIDARTQRLMPLLELLAEYDGPSPLNALRETLVEILVEVRRLATGMAEVELAVRSR